MTTRRALKHTIVQVYEVVPNKKPTLEDLREKTVYDSDGQVLYTITIEPLPPVQANRPIANANIPAANTSSVAMTPPATP
ncbi:hypothetical protein CAEBREN_25389 [Caenorhabditis brenneri]|uniref:Uncharacterized protein n=1 Tax=Caenorhabditis brenneri TaxID=135651 RepID=G0N4X0_CAEBE|nr:hypothetical protein CAEBREN_25389 [Caenorhabditis brenneri]